MKRAFDLVVSISAVTLLSPLFFVISVAIIVDSGWPVFYRQLRIGRFRKPFHIFKFRTMHPGSDRQGLLTIGGSDKRVTHTGLFLRRYKLDELPQFLNVIAGDMSLVGPRPEVQKYVDLYTAEQNRVLEVRPGITDYASIEYSKESDLLAASADPEREYTERIMPAKLKLNLDYIRESGFFTDLKILFKTIRKIWS